MAKASRSCSVAYENMDYYDEYIYRMDTQEIKNLHQLEDYRVFNSKGGIERTLTQNYEQLEKNLTSNKVEQTWAEEEDVTLTLKRLVIVKQYAPETFRRIRLLNNVRDEHLWESLDPS